MFKLVQIESFSRQQNKYNLKADFFLGWVEKIVGDGENAGYQHFLFFRECFQKASFLCLLKKSGLCGKGLNPTEKYFIHLNNRD